MRFDKAFKFTEENEGGFVNDPHDSGGATICGISSRWFPEDYKAVMESEGEERHRAVKAFYRREFWNPLYDNIFYENLAIRLFDLSVNLGKVQAVKILQNTFNDLSQTKITADGKFGQGTLRAVNLPPIQHDAFYNSYVKRVEEYYRTLNNFAHFGKGWLNRLYRNIS